jgi:hypothetical protein
MTPLRAALIDELVELDSSDAKRAAGYGLLLERLSHDEDRASDHNGAQRSAGDVVAEVGGGLALLWRWHGLHKLIC